MMSIKCILLVMALAGSASAYRVEVKKSADGPHRSIPNPELDTNAAFGDELATIDEDGFYDEGDEFLEMMMETGLVATDIRTKQSTLPGGTRGTKIKPVDLTKTVNPTTGAASTTKALGEQVALTIVRATKASVAVQRTQKRNNDIEIVSLSNFQTTLAFNSGAGSLTEASEDSLAAIADEVLKEQMGVEDAPLGCGPRSENGECKFHFCLYVGTTAGRRNGTTEDNRKSLRDPQLMTKRVTSLMEAMQREHILSHNPEHNTFATQDSYTTDLAYFGVARFATFMMKTYTGDHPPVCSLSDIKPPADE